MNVWKCKLIFPTDTLQQKIEITDLKPFLAGENTSVPIILATTVCVVCIIFAMIIFWCLCSNIRTFFLGNQEVFVRFTILSFTVLSLVYFALLD